MNKRLTELILDANKPVPVADRVAILRLIEKQAARIAELEAQIAASPTVQVYQVRTGDCWLDMTKEQFDNHSKSLPTQILYAPAQSANGETK